MFKFLLILKSTFLTAEIGNHLNMSEKSDNKFIRFLHSLVSNSDSEKVCRVATLDFLYGGRMYDITNKKRNPEI